MAIIDEVEGDVNDNVKTTSDALQTLRILAAYARYDALDAPTLDELDAWKAAALLTIHKLHDDPPIFLCPEEIAELIFAVASFRGDGEWTSDEMSERASGILTALVPETPVPVPLMDHILTHHLKPIFRPTPHPEINLETGRKLPRPAGGPLANQDAYEGQVWKAHPGAGNVLQWVVENIESDAYERLWYLVVPPTMTLLDDFEAKYKLQGVRVANALLSNAPPDLLRRTGIADLLFSSLHRTLTHLHSPLTPALIRNAVPTAVKLVSRTTAPGSERQFMQLCALLGDGIIGSVWMYGYQDADAVEAGVDALPDVVSALGIGTVRYLKALIPQLTHPLHLMPFNATRPSLQLASLKALLCVMRECAPRVHAWRGTILEGAAKCWVGLVDAGKKDQDSMALKDLLREVCVSLAEFAPAAVEDYRKLLALDSHMFEGLLGKITSAPQPAPDAEATEE
ncbi:hypothetical protein EWM64_g9489 [Hericium alpestre]|uniref:Uncharacterized protein n=1 Tax=Hericium alpestre TaxID=135208 RepID=A0A4Y9ZKU2_9AGAM|nr:hypothetical protein EWM64_g9489 [Hericium alpestre]